ncbi:MAG: SDR family NAD(P)-dependent oxidoreductase [Bacteroidota bacterium]
MKEQIKSVLITGANAGLGKEAARLFAQESSIHTIYLACRNLQKGKQAKAELEQLTGEKKFTLVQMDVASLASVKEAVLNLPESIDALVMNAGGFGDKNASELTEDGVTQIFAVNVLGHAALLDSLIEQDKLNKVAVFVSSEIARGSEALKAPAPSFSSHSVDEFTQIATGDYFSKWDPMQVYGYVKYTGTLWMSHMQKKFPGLRFASVSPGSTSGTNAADNFPLPMKIMFKYIMFPLILPMRGLAHKVDKGAKRYVDVVMNPAYNAGRFYGSQKHTLTGKLVNQGEFFPNFHNQAYQENAYQAVSELI